VKEEFPAKMWSWSTSSGIQLLHCLSDNM